MTQTSLATGSCLRRLTISRFRGIDSFDWRPAPGTNIILGGGDTGKTTVLEAIALLLSPTNPATVSDTEYLDRLVEGEFEINATLTIPTGSGIYEQAKPAWPWEWDGERAAVPDIEGDAVSIRDPVFCVRVRGTADLELVHELLQPSGEIDSFTQGMRRSVGIVRLQDDDSSDRNLRLVQGSALDKLLSDRGLRSRMASGLSRVNVSDELASEARTALKALDGEFILRGLPGGLDVAITGSQGVSIASLVGLTASRNGIQLPLSRWGAGTRRLATLAISEQTVNSSPITLVDEIERGLEPYRQRLLVGKLENGSSQVFMTTHSPAVIASVSEATVWYMDQSGKIGSLERKQIVDHLRSDPEAFLSRFTIVAEGVTEVGFIRGLLERSLESPLGTFGIYLADGRGHERTLGLIEALCVGGLSVGAFADNEGGKHPDRWRAVGDKLGARLFRWNEGCLEENILAGLAEDQLESFVSDPANEKTGVRLRSLADRLMIEDKSFAAIKAAAGGELRRIITDLATGKVPSGSERAEIKTAKSATANWFKSEEGGHELCEKMFALGAWPRLKPELMTFCNSIRLVAGKEIQDDVV